MLNLLDDIWSWPSVEIRGEKVLYSNSFIWISVWTDFILYSSDCSHLVTFTCMENIWPEIEIDCYNCVLAGCQIVFYKRFSMFKFGKGTKFQYLYIRLENSQSGLEMLESCIRLLMKLHYLENYVYLTILCISPGNYFSSY